MSNIFEIFIVCALLAYLLNRFLLWASGLILNKIVLQKRIIWVHVLGAAILVCLMLWGDEAGPLNISEEKMIALLVAPFISYFAISYEAKLKSGTFGSAPEVGTPVGMGGFLSFFTFMISVFAPLSQLGKINSAIRQTEQNFPSSISSMNLTIALTVAGICTVAFCYAGIILRSDFRKETVNKVVAIMWVCGPVAIVINFLNNYYFNKFNFDRITSEGLNGQLIGAIFWAAIGTAYLVQSKRVRNTYP
jgi:hypothetical protein